MRVAEWDAVGERFANLRRAIEEDRLRILEDLKHVRRSLYGPLPPIPDVNIPELPSPNAAL